jgi:hypothetical protein
MRDTRNKLGVRLEWLTTVAVVLVVAGSMYRAFWVPYAGLLTVESFSRLQQFADALRRETDATRREGLMSQENLGVNLASLKYRVFDTIIPTNARVFVLDIPACVSETPLPQSNPASAFLAPQRRLSTESPDRGNA